MDEGLAGAISRLPDLERLKTYEANALARNRLDDEMRAALRERQIELGRILVAERTGLDLSRLTKAEEGIVRAVSEYASIKRRAGTNAQRTLKQLRERGLIGAAEASVMKAKPTQGYDELVENGLGELSYERIVVENSDEFTDRALWFSRRTLGLPNTSSQPPVRGLSSTQRRTAALLGWYADRARSLSGKLGVYSNADAAAALGMTDMSLYGRVFGNIQSRIDFACYRAGLPPLGLAAVAPFSEAWQPEERSWSFPIAAMQEASKTFTWTDADFDRVLDESEALPGQASISWHEDLSSRAEAVRAWAEGLHPNGIGAEVTKTRNTSGRNPNWTREEIILALDLYFKMRGSSYDDELPEVKALSSELLALASIRGMSGNGSFRNPAGVSMKMMNLRRLDPTYKVDGKVGLEGGGNVEESVWNEFAGNHAALDVAAIEIRRIINGDAGIPIPTPTISFEAAQQIASILELDDDHDTEASARLAQLELVYGQAPPKKKDRVSKYIERGPIGAEVKKANGYRCQLCAVLGMNPVGFKKRKTGIPYVEAHHVTHVATGQVGSLSVRNVMTLCANHHREIHYGEIEVEVMAETFVLIQGKQRLEVPRYRSPIDAI